MPNNNTDYRCYIHIDTYPHIVRTRTNDLACVRVVRRKLDRNTIGSGSLRVFCDSRTNLAAQATDARCTTKCESDLSSEIRASSSDKSMQPSAHPNKAPKKLLDDDSFLSASATSCNAFCSLSAMMIVHKYFPVEFFKRPDSSTLLDNYHPLSPVRIATTSRH